MTAAGGGGRRWVPAAVALGLASLVWAVFGRTTGFGFVNLDDQTYLTANDVVRGGLRWEGVAWAFTTFEGSNWHPLTWLSHMADVEFLGMAPGGHHAVAVSLHALATAMLFLWLRQATGSTGRSALAAALFGVHPLHVEPVAWIAQRKELLCTLFWIAGMMAHVSWTRRGGVARYLAVVGALALALLAKPMAVTFPFALLLVDLWPLGRAGDAPTWRGVGRLAVEKVPLLALAAASAVVTVSAQRGLAMSTLAEVPLGTRVVNAVVSLATYLEKAIWPAGLAPFYPHPHVSGHAPSALRVGASAAVLLLLSAGALSAWRRRPYLAWGWLWYLGTLVPVIGLVQVGLQSHADRYSYVPLIGIFVAASWLAASLVPDRPWARAAAAAMAVVVVGAFAAAASAQVEHWRDSEALWRRTLAVTDESAPAWKGLGDALLDTGRPAEGIAAHARALQLRPGDGAAASGMGVGLAQLGRYPEAEARFLQAVRLEPANADAWYNLGTTRGTMGDHAQAAEAFARAVALRPDGVLGWANLAVARAALGDLAGAEAAMRQVERLDPARAAAMRRR